MLAKAGFGVALAIGLIGGVFGTLPVGAIEMNNEEQILHQPNSGSGTGVVINEVEMNAPGRDIDKEWIELYNPTATDINIGNFAISVQNLQFVITIPSGTMIGAGQFYVIMVEGQKFPDKFGETLRLLDSGGRIIDITPSLLDKRNDARTWQRMPDGSSTWRFEVSSLGGPNDAATYQETSTSTRVATTSEASAPSCLGLALCIEGKVIKMVDTDTLYVVSEGQRYKVDLSLTKVSRSDRNYDDSSKITKYNCLGGNVLVDQDDGQSKLDRKNNVLSIKGVVYCGSFNLNQALLDSGFVGLDFRQCFVSEFSSQDWALRNGCK